MADALRGGIVINEILADPNGSSNFDTDSNGTANSTDEYVEFYNASTNAIDLSDLQLWDQGTGHWFTFPSNSILQPGAHATVIAGLQSGGSFPTGGADDLYFDAGRGKAVINNDEDNIVLYDPAAGKFIQAAFNGASLVDPKDSFSDFPSSATRIGAGENFGDDIDGFSIQRSGDGSDDTAVGDPTPGTVNICFASGTFIDCGDQTVIVDDIRLGSYVRTIDRGIKPVCWVSSKHWTEAEVTANPKLAPIEISAGALGDSLPTSALRVSRQHRVLVQGKIALRMFGTSEVLVPAISLVGAPGISIVMPEGGVTYFHIMFERHELVLSNGVPTESYYLGELAVGAISENARSEIEEILDINLTDIMNGEAQTIAARMFVKGAKAKQLVNRHIENGVPLLESTGLR